MARDFFLSAARFILSELAKGRRAGAGASYLKEPFIPLYKDSLGSLKRRSRRR
jgi:hypothetical protein